MPSPTLAITMGDPAGIGPEVALKALRKYKTNRTKIIFIGDFAYVSKFFSSCSVKNTEQFSFIDLKNVPLKSFRFGNPTRANGAASGEYIHHAVRLALRGAVQGIVTAPINKRSFFMGGWGGEFRGHTEMLAELSGATNVSLMLVVENLRAIHVTSHIALKNVPRQLTLKRIAATIRTGHNGLREMGIRRPRMAVCALNPHAGENGLMGNEDMRIILPAVKQCRRQGIRCEGPFPADIVWPLVESGQYDAGVAMYHDQGQIPVKLRGFRFEKSQTVPIVSGVNVTLGLPFVRTSPAHGTAYDIAGKNKASEKSFLDALILAARMIR